MFYIPCNLFISSLKYLFSGIILKINPRVWFSHHAESLIFFLIISIHIIIVSCLKIILAHARLSSPDSGNFLASYSIIKAILFSHVTSHNYLDKSGVLHASVLKQFILEKERVSSLSAWQIPTQMSKPGFKPTSCCLLLGQSLRFFFFFLEILPWTFIKAFYLIIII